MNNLINIFFYLIFFFFFFFKKKNRDIFGINLTQDNINDISILENLESL